MLWDRLGKADAKTEEGRREGRNWRREEGIEGGREDEDRGEVEEGRGGGGGASLTSLNAPKTAKLHSPIPPNTFVGCGYE